LVGRLIGTHLSEPGFGEIFGIKKMDFKNLINLLISPNPGSDSEEMSISNVHSDLIEL
jgi:hypothetical protein